MKSFLVKQLHVHSTIKKKQKKIEIFKLSKTQKKDVDFFLLNLFGLNSLTDLFYSLYTFFF